MNLLTTRMRSPRDFVQDWSNGWIRLLMDWHWCDKIRWPRLIIFEDFVSSKVCICTPYYIIISLPWKKWLTQWAQVDKVGNGVNQYVWFEVSQGWNRVNTLERLFVDGWLGINGWTRNRSDVVKLMDEWIGSDGIHRWKSKFNRINDDRSNE